MWRSRLATQPFDVVGGRVSPSLSLPGPGEDPVLAVDADPLFKTSVRCRCGATGRRPLPREYGAHPGCVGAWRET